MFFSPLRTEGEKFPHHGKQEHKLNKESLQRHHELAEKYFGKIRYSTFSVGNKNTGDYLLCFNYFGTLLD